MRFCSAFCFNRSAHRAQLKRTMTEHERSDEVGVRGRGKGVPYEANAMCQQAGAVGQRKSARADHNLEKFGCLE